MKMKALEAYIETLEKRMAWHDEEYTNQCEEKQQGVQQGAYEALERVIDELKSMLKDATTD